MTKGIVLMAFGKSGYYQMAFIMALSIKIFNPELQVCLISDGKEQSHLSGRTFVFDTIEHMDTRDCMTLGSIDPGKAKTRIYQYLPFDHNLYLDVDGIVLKDITPMLDTLVAKEGYYLTDVIGRGGMADNIEYAIWASNETTYKHFDIPQANELVTIQSSYAYFQKTPECEDFCEQVASYYDTFDIKDLLIAWGTTKPDELFFSGVISKLGINAQGGKFIFFGHEVKTVQHSVIKENNYILSIYGNGNGSRLTKLIYWELYDKLMRNYSLEYGRTNNIILPHIYKTNGFASQKHAGQRK